MIVDTTYKILIIATGEVHTFTTSRTEKDFYATLDAVYGKDNYQTLEVSKSM